MEFDIKSYVQQLEERRAESNRLHKIRQEAETAALLAASIEKIKRTKPLDQQITELMRSLPPALRNRPWTMDELVNRLVGRYHDHPHAQHVGEALRRLGWKRERRWGEGYEGKRIWLPDFCLEET